MAKKESGTGQRRRRRKRPEYEVIQSRLPKPDYERLIQICDKEMVSVAAYVRRILLTYMPGGN